MRKPTNCLIHIVYHALAIIVLMLSITSSYAEGSRSESDVAIEFTTPEISKAIFTCSAQWDEYCSDQQSVAAPQGYKICEHLVTVSEQQGDSSHEIVDESDQQVSVKFAAKGNLDRYNKQSSYIEIIVRLHGVRNGEPCEKLPEPVVEETPEPTPHACACSPWIYASEAQECLSKGKKCEKMQADVHCVTDKTSCRDIQRKTCPNVVGLDQSKSNKRLYITDSPHCAAQD